MTFHLTNAAVEDLLNIYVEGIENFGVAVADAYQDTIDNSIRTIGENPKIARLRTEIIPPVRGHPVRSHVVIYRIDDVGHAIILRVRHGSENWTDTPV